MRIRRTLFVLSLTLLGGATPPHQGPVAPGRCLSGPAPQRMAEHTSDFLGSSLHAPMPLPRYDAEARDYLIRTLVFEAAEEPDEGKAAVVHVILNRMRSKRWGDSVKEVVTEPWQFEPWMTRKREIRNLAVDDPRYIEAARITDAVLAGILPDPTEGATHFLNPDIVRKRRGGSLPPWARGRGQAIGKHTFYIVDEELALPRDAILSLGEALDLDATLKTRPRC
ncbi:MAG TPA: cell wall hydrolase [Methyloceanibacter sp.]|nr:cell wall hydrolase [Methyloceanibacter sp.]